MIPSFTNYANIVPIGSGAFATVYRALHLPTSRSVALKVFSDNEDKEEDEAPDFEKEVKIHRLVDHPFVAMYYGSFVQGKKSVIVMEYVPGQTLLEIVNGNQTLCENKVQQIFCQLISAVDYLHTVRNIVHRDLKLENIIIGPNNMIKIIDFGLSNISKGLLSTQCASFPYAAPELYLGEKYSSKIDIWSCGVILYALLTSSLPFESEDIFKLSEKIINDEPDYSSIKSLLAIDLLRHLLDKDPNERYNSKQVINHPWIKRSQLAHIFAVNSILNKSTMVFPLRKCDIDERAIQFIKLEKHLNTDLLSPNFFLTNDTDETMMYKIIRRPSTNLEASNKILNNEFREHSSSMLLPMISCTDNNLTIIQHSQVHFTGRKQEMLLLNKIDNYNIKNVPIRFRVGQTFNVQYTFQPGDD